MPREAAWGDRRENKRREVSAILSARHSWPRLETTSSVSPRGDASYSSLSGSLRLHPSRGRRLWQPLVAGGPSRISGETTVEAEEAVAATPVSSASKGK